MALLAFALLSSAFETNTAPLPAHAGISAQTPASETPAPRKTAFNWIRMLFVWAIWIGVGVVIVPVARRKRVSSLKWYFLGLGAFYGPFLAIAYGPIFLSVLVDQDPRDRWFLKLVLDHFGKLVSAGVAAGIACLYRMKRRLQRRPDPPGETATVG